MDFHFLNPWHGNFPNQLGRGTANNGVRLHIFGHNGIRGDNGAFSYGNVVGNTNILGKERISAYLHAAGKLRICDQHRIIADLNVMRDMAMIIDFHSVGDPRLVKRCTVYRNQ